MHPQLSFGLYACIINAFSSKCLRRRKSERVSERMREIERKANSLEKEMRSVYKLVAKYNSSSGLCAFVFVRVASLGECSILFPLQKQNLNENRWKCRLLLF